MAVVSGTVWSVHTTRSDAIHDLQEAEVLFTVSGTYVQAENGILSGVPTLIQNSRRNGKTVTMRYVMASTPAQSAVTPTTILGLKTVAISSSDVTFEITDNDYSTEYANATALPAQLRPFAIKVAFTEA